ncbi:TPA: phosphoenolpyruvate--protein phosphotransferase [Escherichia coli]
MLTRLREIVERVASAPRLNEALNILVTDICLAMDTEVCSVYLADHDRRCYYLMATRGLKKPRGRTVTLAFDEGIVGLVGRLAEPINLADAQKHPSFKYIPSVKEERFRAFLGVPIIQRRQLLGVLVVQQRELRQYDESEESFLVTLATQMAAILSQSQLTALFGQYRQTRIRALPAAPGVAIAEGWQDATLPLMEQVYQASTLDPALERERLTGALEEAANEFRRYSKRFAAGAQKETAAIFDLYSHLLSDTRLRRELFAEVDKGSVAEWAVKTVIEKFAEQFAALSDNYLKERAGDLRALGQRLLFHLDDANQGPNAWPERFILLPMVTSLDEVDEARRLIERAGREVEEMIGYEIPKPRIGIMLEVPSMVFMLPHLAKRVDFISVGTNDLTQYILAVDRNNTRVANIYDSLHPAMLRALAMIAREAEIHGIDLRLCGEMAGDPMCVAILIGLGYRHLSMNGRSVARVKYLLRRIDFAEAENLAQRSLEAQLATEVRHQVAAFMERRGMGGLIRGGL